MAEKGYRLRILEILEDGPTLVSSIAETSLLPANRFTAGFALGNFDDPGKTVAFEFSGKMSCRAGADTLRLRLFFGAVGVFDSGQIPLNAVAKANVQWALSGELVCRAASGGAGTLFFPKRVVFESEALIGSPLSSAGGCGRLLLPVGAAPAVGTGIDNGASYVCDLRATHSVNNANNSITLQAGHFDVYN